MKLCLNCKYFIDGPNHGCKHPDYLEYSEFLGRKVPSKPPINRSKNGVCGEEARGWEQKNDHS